MWICCTISLTPYIDFFFLSGIQISETKTNTQLQFIIFLLCAFYLSLLPWKNVYKMLINYITRVIASYSIINYDEKLYTSLCIYILISCKTITNAMLISPYFIKDKPVDRLHSTGRPVTLSRSTGYLQPVVMCTRPVDTGHCVSSGH